MEFIKNNWWYIILFGAMAYMMFRGGGCCGGRNNTSSNSGRNNGGGGCCGDHSNSGRNHDNIHKNNPVGSNIQGSSMNMVKDPICGMYVNPNTALKEVRDGQEYYFCSESCRIEFLKRR